MINPMSSSDSQVKSSRVDGEELELEDGKSEKEELGQARKRGENKIRRRKSSKEGLQIMLKFGCFNSDPHPPVAVDMELVNGHGHPPTHLVIMVNGLIGSAQNWKFAAKQFLNKYPHDVIVHCSQCNSNMLTFDGVDVMGERLAEEVVSVIKRHPGLQKISIVGHSLGGLIARYTIAVLYGLDISRASSVGNLSCDSNTPRERSPNMKYDGKIAGLEPINFITFATPHLGSRGHKQVPVFCGFLTLEKLASRTSWCFGRTGRHLFLSDGGSGKPPLLLRMVHDCEDLKFMSALQSFKRRVAYANVRYDQLVGWSTSSIRRRNELPKRRELSRHPRYLHIVNVEKIETVCVAREVPSKAEVNGCENIDMEENMIRGLTTLCWERVDVDFRGSRQRYLAHSTIQVKTFRINSDGAVVVQHMVDHFVL